jgi:hypothetical protein
MVKLIYPRILVFKNGVTSMNRVTSVSFNQVKCSPWSLLPWLARQIYCLETWKRYLVSTVKCSYRTWKTASPTQSLLLSASLKGYDISDWCDDKPNFIYFTRK